MCMVCEGFSIDDAVALDAARLAEYGFIVQAVGPADGRPNATEWAYTVGLLDAVGHPELIVAGPAAQRGGELLVDLAHAVLDEGARFDVGDTFGGPAPNVYRVGAVHPSQYALSTFNTWHNLQSIGALETDELEALQIFVPPTWFCECHRHVQPVLATPGVRLDLPQPANRAARRGARNIA